MTATTSAHRACVSWIAPYILPLLLIACSAKEKPAFAPFTNEHDAGTGDGGAVVSTSDSQDGGGGSGGGTKPSRAPSVGSGGAANLGKLDPDQVYLVGALDPMAHPVNAIARLDHVDATEFVPADMRLPAVRRSDGRVIYSGSMEVKADAGTTFRNAVFAFMGSADPIDRKPIPTPACDAAPQGVSSFRLHPETGDILYSCANPDFCVGLLGSHSDSWAWLNPIRCNKGPWWDKDGQMVIDTWLLSVGYGDLLLLGTQLDTSDLAIYNRKTMQTANVVVPQDRVADDVAPTAVRALPDGFWLVVQGSDQTLWRWHIAKDGSVEEQGKYSALPSDVSQSSVFNADTSMNVIALDAKGALYESAWQQTKNNDKAIDVIVKRVLDPGKTSIAYTEADSPWIKGTKGNGFLYGVPDSFLFTGP